MLNVGSSLVKFCNGLLFQHLLFRFFRPQRKVVKFGKGLLDYLERSHAHPLCNMYSLGHMYN